MLSLKAWKSDGIPPLNVFESQGVPVIDASFVASIGNTVSSNQAIRTLNGIGIVKRK